MKLQSIVNGMVAVKLVSEEILPDHRPPTPDYFAAIIGRYNFMGQSDYTVGQPVLFQNGRVSWPNRKPTQFTQLHILRNGDIVTASTTRDADEIMDDFLNFIVNDFGFKIEIRELERFYMSDVIVEFDNDRKNILSSTLFLENVIAKYFPERRHLKNLNFGIKQDDSGIDAPGQIGPIAAMKNADFIIERRLGSEPSINRFYSRAPMRNEDHLKLLEEIEATISSF